MPSLRSIAVRRDDPDPGFPFDIPAVATLGELRLDRPVTFLVGENGSGKSTLLEAVAAAARLPAVGGLDLDRDPTLAAQRRLGRALRLTWERRTHRGFFLRAEDFFGFVRRLSRERDELRRGLDAAEREYVDPYSRQLAQGPLRSSLGAMQRRYGDDLDALSHGESFLQLFRARFVPGGLHLLDEPEAALSPQSQLGLLAALFEMIEQDAQFIIATHSPLLLAFPDARIFSFDEIPVAPVEYDSLEHVRLTREFLAAPERYLSHLRPR